MVKSYLKYEPAKTFGLITSAFANAVWCEDEDAQNVSQRSSGGGRAIVGANGEVLCWDLKKGELLSRWKDDTCSAEVRIITRSAADPDIYAVGYGDGSIRIWDSRIAIAIINLNGHKSAISALAFDKDGVRLASGARDTDIIIWDLVAEVGLCKLRGHKDQVTGLQYIHPRDERSRSNAHVDDEETQANSRLMNDSQADTYLLSTSKDALIKVWDTKSRHCIETHVAQSNGECWALAVSPDGARAITAGNDGELRVWSIDLGVLAKAAANVSEVTSENSLHSRGALYRQAKDRTVGVTFHPSGSYVAAHGSDKAIDVWRIRSESEIQKTLIRKRKRRREKVAAIADHIGQAHETLPGVNDTEDISAQVTDIIVPFAILRTGGKVRSIDWASKTPSQGLQILAATTNNELELYKISTKQKDKSSKSDEPPDYNRLFSVDTAGHRTDVRSLALSSDDRMLASASNGALKIWNVRTQSCIRTLDCGYALCATFLPGDKIVIVGNREGELEVFDIASSALIESVKAHEGPVWTLHVHPDGKSIATGSADKSAKFFYFEIIQDEIPGTKRTTSRFRLAHHRTLKVSDDILNLRFSPDSRLVALSLLDNTVKVFFTDSLKLFLNLYGHKLPVLNMDISYDSKLIVTCSADKNVRLWGLDFGDCHKAFFAHQDSIMQVAFVPHNQDGNGHHFFSASKDRVIKYWDGDKFEQIQRLEGHHGEIWALAVSRMGEFIVSASHDKSIRVWNQTDEQIFLEEEKEKELEELYEATLTTNLETDDAGEQKAEAISAGKQTVETLMAGERIVEALDLGMADLDIMREYHEAKATQPNVAPPSRHPMYLAYNNISAEDHLLDVIQKIKAAALQDALLVLPFDKAIALFTFLRIWAERQRNMPLTCRVLFFILKTHHKQIIASKGIRTLLDEIRQELRYSLQTQKDELGFNLAALRFIGRKVGEDKRTEYVDENIWDDENMIKGSKKRTFIDVA